MGESLAQSRYKEEGLGPTSSDMADFFDFSWKTSISLRNGCGWGRVRWREWEKRRERKLGFICKKGLFLKVKGKKKKEKVDRTFLEISTKKVFFTLLVQKKSE